MNSHILISIVAGLLNMAFSVIVPCLVKKSKSTNSFVEDIKKVYDVNRQVILTSSLIVGLTVFLALKVSPEVQITLENLDILDTLSSDSSFSPMPKMGSDLSNLVYLSK